MSFEIELKMLDTVAKALGDLNSKVVFVGGAIVFLYMEQKGSPSPLATEDVDLIVELSTHQEYAKFEKNLRSKGFKHDQSSKHIARFVISGISVDIIPSKKQVLGFGGKWEELAILNKIEKTLSTGTKIYIPPIEIFLTLKLNAFLDRGREAPRLSKDLEDILLVIDSSDHLATLTKSQTNEEAVKFLQYHISRVFTQSNITELVCAHIGPNEANRAPILFSKISNFCYKRS